MPPQVPRIPSPWPVESDSEPRRVSQIARSPVLPGTRPSGFLRTVLAAPPRYAPGDSPFHVKGHVYRSSMGYYASVLPEGVASLDEHLDPPFQAFFQQHFLTASWYDALPLLPLSIAASRARNMPYHTAMLERARAQAEADIPGIYRAILNIASPEILATRIGRAVTKYFDYGEATSGICEEGLCEVIQRGVPMPLVPLGAPLAEGFIVTAFALAGAKATTFRADLPERDGDVEGTPTYLLRFTIAWR